MQDEIFLGIIDLFVYQFHCATELVGVGKQGTVGHPKDVSCLFRYYIGQCTAHGDFNFLNFIKHEKAKFFVEPIKFNGRVKTAALLEKLPVFGNFKKWIKVCA